MSNETLTCLVTKQNIIGQRIWGDNSYVDLKFPVYLQTGERYNPDEKISAFSKSEVVREATPSEIETWIEHTILDHF